MAVEFDACIVAYENNGLLAAFAAQCQLACRNADDGATDLDFFAVGYAGRGRIGVIVRRGLLPKPRSDGTYGQKSKEKHPKRIHSYSITTHISTPFGSIRLASLNAASFRSTTAEPPPLSIRRSARV
jgi:hypothetical protein